MSPRRWATKTSEVKAGNWGDVALRLEGTGMFIGFCDELVVDILSGSVGVIWYCKVLAISCSIRDLLQYAVLSLCADLQHGVER